METLLTVPTLQAPATHVGGLQIEGEEQLNIWTEFVNAVAEVVDATSVNEDALE